jgi:hypothetical protein
MVGISGLHRLRTDKIELYGFSLTLEGFIVNGFVYNPVSKSIKMPGCSFQGKRVPLVKAFGVHVKRLQARLDDAITKWKAQELNDGIDD